MKISAEEIAAALLTRRSVTDAAASLGRSRRWLQRQMAKPEVQEAIDRLRRETVERASMLLTASVAEAALTLLNLLRTGSERTQLDVARWVLDRVLFKGSTTTDPDTVTVVDD